MSLKVLIITPDFPFPANHGGRVDYYNRIKCLAEIGLEVYLISTVSEEIKVEFIQEMKKYVKEIFTVKRSNSIKHIFSITPFQILSRKGLSEIDLSNYLFDYVLLESEYVLEALKNTTLKYKKKYLRIHNIESKYFYSLSLSVFPKVSFLYYLSDALKFYIIKKKLSHKFDRYLFISSDEMKNTLSMGESLHLLPVYSATDKMKSCDNKNSKVVLFMGSLFMPNNLESLDFYLKHIHEKLLDVDGYEFLVVGSTKSNKELQQNIIAKYKKNKSVSFCFDVKHSEIDSFYDKARVFVNPVLHGAGVKMKVLESIRNGLPVVSTPKGVEGTGLINNLEVLVRKDPKEFSDAIRLIIGDKIDDKSMVLKAQQKLNNSYDTLVDLFKS